MGTNLESGGRGFESLRARQHFAPSVGNLLEMVVGKYPSAEGRLPESLHFAESNVILGVVTARSVHKVGSGHNCDWAAA
jgi:hypothetical protein